MALIGIACPDCTSDTAVPARALLATIDLSCPHEPLGQLSWACPDCERFVTAELDVGNLLRLVTAGVHLLDDGFGDSTVAEECTECTSATGLHNERPRTDAPFTLEDVLTLRELLQTEAWIQELGAGRDRPTW